MRGADLIPKPRDKGIAMLVTGNSQQSMEWISEHSDGWLTYARHPAQQRVLTEQWHAASGDTFKPFAQALQVDLADDPEEAPTQIHNGYRLGRKRLIELFEALQHIGVNHCFMNVKFARRPAPEIVEELAAEVLPLFPTPDD
jgi:luciferase-type oxidoreductase